MTDERLLRLLGLRVKQLRMQRNLTQEGMGKFGFEIKYYQKLEYGQKNISVKTLHRLAKAFDVPVAESGLSAFPQHVSEFIPGQVREALDKIRDLYGLEKIVDTAVPVKALPAPEGADKDTVTASEPDAVSIGGTATEAEASLGRAGDGADAGG